MLFTLNDGPKSNTYIAPSGATYRVLKGVAFEVSDDRDVEYFKKKNTFTSEESLDLVETFKNNFFKAKIADLLEFSLFSCPLSSFVIGKSIILLK